MHYKDKHFNIQHKMKITNIVLFLQHTVQIESLLRNSLLGMERKYCFVNNRDTNVVVLQILLIPKIVYFPSVFSTFLLQECVSIILNSSMQIFSRNNYNKHCAEIDIKSYIATDPLNRYIAFKWKPNDILKRDL